MRYERASLLNIKPHRGKYKTLPRKTAFFAAENRGPYS